MKSTNEFLSILDISLEDYYKLNDYPISYSNFFEISNETIKCDIMEINLFEEVMQQEIELTGPNRYIFETHFEFFNYENIMKDRDNNWIQKVIIENLKDISNLRGNDIFLISYNNSIKDNIMILDDVSSIYSVLSKGEKKSKNLDIIIKSTGGHLGIPALLLNQFYSKYENVNFLIPHVAHSAATLLCLGGKEIIMHNNATLSPYDPQINGIPAFITAKTAKEYTERRKSKMAIKNAKKLSRNIILEYMLNCHKSNIINDYNGIFNQIKQIIKCKNNYFKALKLTHYFTNYNSHFDHNTHLFLKDIKQLGINVNTPDSQLETLMWENELLVSYFFETTSTMKLFSNTEHNLHVYDQSNS